MEILITVLVGFGVVFLGLVLICALIFLLHKLLSHKKKTENKEIQITQAKEEEMSEEVLVAILTAAIAAYTPQSAGKFRVVSFRRRPQGPTH